MHLVWSPCTHSGWHSGWHRRWLHTSSSPQPPGVTVDPAQHPEPCSRVPTKHEGHGLDRHGKASRRGGEGRVRSNSQRVGPDTSDTLTDAQRAGHITDSPGTSRSLRLHLGCWQSATLPSPTHPGPARGNTAAPRRHSFQRPVQLRETEARKAGFGGRHNLESKTDVGASPSCTTCAAWL